MNSEGVSEVVGSLLVLVVIVSVAGIIYTMSYPTIWGGQENVKMRNAYFDIFELREKIERVRSGLEFKSIHTLQLQGLSVSFGNEPMITLNNKSYELSSIKLIGKDSFVAYENGAIIMYQAGKARITSSPNINYVKETKTLYFPMIRLATNLSAGGFGALTVYLHLKTVETIVGNGSIVFYSAHADAWEEFFKITGVNFTRSGNNITIQNVEYFAVIYEVEVYG